MARNLARRATHQKALSKAEAQEQALEAIRNGAKVSEAMAHVGRSEATYKDWTKDAEFNSRLRHIRNAQADIRDAGDDGRVPVPDFPEFCDEIGFPLYEHQLRAWDVMNGRAPRAMHPSIRYQKGRQSMMLFNFPPDHGKSTTFTVNFVTWLILRNPSIQIGVVSAGQRLAKDFLFDVKQRLTSRAYENIHLKYAPDGGWKTSEGSWTSTEIYVAGRDGRRKDPTVQALGFGQHIYGARLDILIFDDLIDLANASQVESQLRKLKLEYFSRLPDALDPDGNVSPEHGMIIGLGTRMAPGDLYEVLRDETDDPPEDAEEGTPEPPMWTYLAQPAVLEYAEKPSDWVTLWPRWTTPEGVDKAKWDGPALARKRRQMNDESAWSRSFQQDDIADDAIFPAGAVDSAINRFRQPGRMSGDGKTHRVGGMDGLYVVAGVDPAASGFTAAVAIGLDRQTQKRWVLKLFNKRHTTLQELFALMQQWTVELGVREWRVETNAYQRQIVQLPELRRWMSSAGVLVKEHHTGRNKWDDDSGVMTLPSLFTSCGQPMDNGKWKRTPDTALIDLPDPRLSRECLELVRQLQTYMPPERAKQRALTDLVMALWFAELACRDQLEYGRRRRTHGHNAYLGRRDKQHQNVINLAEIREQVLAERAEHAG